MPTQSGCVLTAQYPEPARATFLVRARTMSVTNDSYLWARRQSCSQNPSSTVLSCWRAATNSMRSWATSSASVGSTTWTRVRSRARSASITTSSRPCAASQKLEHGYRDLTPPSDFYTDFYTPTRNRPGSTGGLRVLDPTVVAGWRSPSFDNACRAHRGSRESDGDASVQT